MNLSNILNIGANGLNAAAHGQNVTGQNISNASTPGYSRRLADLEPIPLKDGGGVRANGSTRVHDRYLERRGLGASAGDGEARARVDTLQVLDSVFSEEAGNLGGALDAFDGALSDFAANPNSRANRDAVLAKAGELSRAFNQTADQLTSARGDANGKITDSVRVVNSKLNDIASLGSKIMLARATGNEAGDLEDRRDQLIREVSSEIPVHVIEDDSGAITLQLASSRTLVGPDGRVSPLVAQMDPGLGDVRIYRETSGQLEDITSLVSTGTIGGTISARDGALATARTQLDQLASDVATAYNTVHAAGYGLDGNTDRNLFSVPAGVAGAATRMSVSADVLGQPDFLGGASEDANLPSDNRNAIALLGVRDAAIGASGSNTAQQAFRAIVADAGTAGQSAAAQAAQASAVKGQVDALREASSGVSADEEMISLMKFQRAYTASLRVIEAADSMLQELLNIRR
jgi:flagellar hook-associated protein 1 FlgK